MKLIRHNHNLSYTHTTSMNAGELIPVAHVEVLPGDTFNMKTSALIRVSPLDFPLMHEVEARVHHWFVPNRILWDGWEDFITGVSDPTATATKMPNFTSDDAANYKIIEYCGGQAIANTNYQAFINGGYNKIWTEFYRDQELQTALTQDNILYTGKIRNVAWNKDYFTTARSSPAQGEAIQVKFSGDSNIPVRGIGIADWDAVTAFSTTRQTGAIQGEMTGWEAHDGGTITGEANVIIEQDTENLLYPNVRADIGGADIGINIDDLRTAMASQRIIEARQLFGTRYTDYLAYYGVKSSDARLQRPEYLGGFTKRIHFSEVLATDGGNTGNLYGHGIAHKSGGRFRKMFEEHGQLYTLMSIRPLAVYQQGRPRKMNRRLPFDYWTREFENTPWQGIGQSEIYSDVANSGTTASVTNDDPVWGYTSRFDEYRETPNQISGAIKQDDATPTNTYSNWHWARFFASKPTSVSSDFVTCSPDDRIFQDSNDPEFIVHLTHSIKAKRLVSKNARIMHAL
ncbi:MAG: major capsid protein [Microviridae sp.]|nr:MAG: major capsid protein [Microviridae sp.]